MSRLLHGFACAAWLFAVARGEGMPGSATSSALRAAGPDRVSAGVFGALDAVGAYGVNPARQSLRAGLPDRSKGRRLAVLDARVGNNVRIGDDPAALPNSQIGQAEPHIYRSATSPDTLLATFQEGRFSDAGSLDCGYGVSRDGGLTWTRSLIPFLTQASGGRFNRATDPVAAIGPQGDFYLNTLASTSGAFDTAAVVVSRSTGNGGTWASPSVVYESTSTQLSPDKNWIAVNDYPDTPTTGRLVVTWTSFTADASGGSTGSNLMAAISDDRGTTWSTPANVTSPGQPNQGSQPVFLPDGSLLVAYVTFMSTTSTSPFVIECKRSTDGGKTFPAGGTTVVGSVIGWDDPDLRDGVFLPAVAVARETGAVFLTFTTVVNGTPRIMVTTSQDRGATWSPAVVASDNPTGSSVMNPAVATTSDGQTVSVVYVDKRNATDGHNFIDVYAAQSFDRGATWRNLRLSDLTSDIRFGPLTSRGYMFGDYLGLAPALVPNQPCVAIWCDARTGDSDPYVARFAPSSDASYQAWRVARFTLAEIADDAISGVAADPDGDGACNFAEYYHATDPKDAETGSAFSVVPLDGQLRFANRHRPVSLQSDPAISEIQWQHSSDGIAWTSVPHSTETDTSDANLRVDLEIVAHATGTPEYFREWYDFPGQPGAAGETIAADTDARLINVSSRGAVGTDAAEMIVGFAVNGTKPMLLRAAGPALAAFGIAHPLALPQLTLTSANVSPSVSVTNASWTQSTATAALFNQLGAFAFLAGSNDAAVVQSFPAGAYTAVVSGANGSTGTALVEAYDADPTSGSVGASRIVNLSTRAAVGDDPLIAGFVVGGTQPRRVLIRVAGPALAPFGVPGALSDPRVTLYRSGSSAVLGRNDDWSRSRSSEAIAATAARVGAFPFVAGSLDSALLITVEPGNYSAVVSGVEGATGIGLVEVYDAN